MSNLCIYLIKLCASLHPFFTFWGLNSWIFFFSLQYCVGQESCSVPVAPEAFGGDPCPNVMKKVSVEAICSWWVQDSVNIWKGPSSVLLHDPYEFSNNLIFFLSSYFIHRRSRQVDHLFPLLPRWSCRNIQHTVLV